jgi:hypothetical protein
MQGALGFAAPFIGKGNQKVVAVFVAAGACEAASQNSAIEIAVKGLFNMVRQ